jgi:type IV pilus assembly protein PilQ
MQDIKINLLAAYQRLQRSHQYRRWAIFIILLFLLSLSSGVYWFLFKPQQAQLLIAQTKTQQMQQEITELTQQAKNTVIPTAAIEPERTPVGHISLQQPTMELRNLLQQIAASAGINLLLHDSVQGNVSVAFNALPWQQALQVVMDLADLTAEQQDDVWVIRSAQEHIKKTQIDLAAEQQLQDLTPVETVLLPVHYAKAQELADLLSTGEQEWLSARGVVSVDERTNTLLVRDIPDNLPAVQSMIQRLDVPVRQVAIEARILNVEESFSQELGLLWSVDGNASISDTSMNNLRMNLPNISTQNNPMNLAITTLSSDILLNLELQALEKENLVEELAHPRLVTADQQTAIIRQGEEIPYQQSAEYGASTISFKPAVLELQVTPHITPDDHIIMKLVVKNDSRSAQALAENVPVITTKEIRTQVLVDNGETIVLGGIFTQGKTQQIERLPFFSDLPGIGRLFSSEAEQNERKELLVFVTPRIIEG